MTIHQSAIMPAASPAEQRFLDLYEKVAARLPGAKHAEVRAAREAALRQFVTLGMPHRRIEEWKYTDLRALMPEVHSLAGLSPKKMAIALEDAIGRPLAALDAHRVVFVDGLFCADYSSLQGVAGLTLSSLRESLQSAGALARLPLPERDVIAALAAGFATDGVRLSVAPGAKLQKPIHLIFVASGGSSSLCALQNVLDIGAGAEVFLIETHAALGAHQCLSSMRLTLGAQAAVKHVRMNFGPTAKHLSSASVLLAGGAQYDPLQMTTDSALTRAEAAITFGGADARCHYTGAMLLRGRNHADFTLVVKHAAPGCESRELAKAVLDEHGHGVFQGKVIVERGAQKTDGKQMANALLLSDNAEFDSKPELEIFADDVVCGHGSTAGQLDEDMLFYLRTRGLPEPEARGLLIAAFIGEALDKIEHEALRDALKEKVDAWLFAN